MKLPTAWSYSSLSKYEECPAKYKYGRIDKLPDPQGPAAARGEMLHARGEQYLLGKIKEIPAGYEHFGAPLRALRLMDAVPEIELGVTAEWKPTGFFAPDVWLRMKLDVLVPPEGKDETAFVDFKSGRYYDSHPEQAEIYALGSAVLHPKLKAVHAEFWYIDSGDVQAWTFDVQPRALSKLKKKWAARAALALDDRAWNPTPSAKACKYCAFRTDRGGPCQSWKLA